MAKKSALLLSDKKIVGTDGTPLEFTLPENDYYIAVKHRNHLPVLSASPVHLTSN